MLVLTRKLGENIRIGDVIKITVLEVRSGQVKLGIDAPAEVKVHREEIYARIQAENRRAAASSPDALRDAARDLTFQDEPRDRKPSFFRADLWGEGRSPRPRPRPGRSITCWS